FFFFFSSRRRHTRCLSDWSSDVCSSDLLTKAGVLLGLDGLTPPAKGARVSFGGGKTKVTDGPFTEAKEVLGGYWMIQVKSRAEEIGRASCRERVWIAVVAGRGERTRQEG